MSETGGETARGAFALVLHGHLPFVLPHGQWPHGSEMVFECAAESYLPLLRVVDRLVGEGISPKMTLGITPVLAEQLAHPDFKQQFTDYLEERERTAAEDRERFHEEGDEHLAYLAERWQKHFAELRKCFLEEYGGDLIGGFRRLAEGGHIEIMTSAATHGYLPLLGADESVQAQVKQAVAAHQRHFGQQPRGFWLPECAYRPRYAWRSPLPDAGPQEPRPRKGVEEFLAENGLRYFIVDTATLLGGAASGVYLERFAALQQMWEQFRASYRPGPADVTKSAYEVYAVASAEEDRPPVAVFTRDERTGLQVWSGDIGYPGDGWYLDFHKKHVPGRHRYWRVTSSDSDMSEKEPYQPDRAAERVPENADHFCRLVHDLIVEHHRDRDRFGVICAPYDMELFGHWWFEGPEWLYRVCKGLAADPTVELMTCSEYLAREVPEAAVALPEGSWGQGGFHWVWLNEWTTWIWKDIYAAEARMPRLAQQALSSGDELLVRIVSQTARELLLLEASDWPFLISTWSARDYAENRAALHHQAFTRLAEMAERRAGGDELSEEDEKFLGECERTDCLFPQLDLAWWAGVERPAT